MNKLKKIIIPLIVILTLVGVLAPAATTVSANTQSTTEHSREDVEELAEALQFYFDDIGHINNEGEYEVINPSLLQERAANGSVADQQLLEMYLAKHAQSRGVVDYGACVITDYFGVYVDLLTGDLLDAFIGHLQSEAWKAAAGILLDVIGETGVTPSAIVTAAQVASAAYSCRDEL